MYSLVLYIDVMCWNHLSMLYFLFLSFLLNVLYTHFKTKYIMTIVNNVIIPAALSLIVYYIALYNYILPYYMLLSFPIVAPDS